MPEYSNDSQARKWMITINNPQDYGFDHETIVEKVQLSNPTYVCMADEIAPSTGTYHTHIFIYSKSPIRFGTLKKRLPVAHIEKSHGTVQENRDYIKKEGKWSNTEKASTQIEGSFQEVGEPPLPAEEKAPKMFLLLQNVKDGLSTTEIIEENPSFSLQTQKIDQLRDSITSEPFRYKHREVQVHYLFGATGTGKTRSIYEKHDIKDICRITDYGGVNGVRFDAYHFQPVLVFEEFASQIPIEAMLNYLDRYPVMLPARYQDKVACYTTVYITSNMPFDDQYSVIQEEKPETWLAFNRRIDTITRYNEDGTTLLLKG